MDKAEWHTFLAEETEGEVRDKFLTLLDDADEPPLEKPSEAEGKPKKRKRHKPVDNREVRRELRTHTYIDGTMVPMESVAEFKRKIRFGYRSVFKEEMCEKVIDILAEGRTLGDLAGMLGVGEQTLRQWIQKDHIAYIPQFAEAVEYGLALSGLWWREIGRLNLMNKDFNVGLYGIHMVNRFGWTRRYDATITSTQVTEEKKTLEIKLEERSVEHVAEILRILSEAGAITAGNTGPPCTETDDVHPS